jgi:hypothetical protein
MDDNSSNKKSQYFISFFCDIYNKNMAVLCKLSIFRFHGDN